MDIFSGACRLLMGRRFHMESLIFGLWVAYVLVFQDLHAEAPGRVGSVKVYEFNKYIFHAWFRGLYDEGMRSVLARHPNKGYTSCTSWNIRMPFAALGLPLCIGRRFLMGSMQPHESSVQ